MTEPRDWDKRVRGAEVTIQGACSSTTHGVDKESLVSINHELKECCNLQAYRKASSLFLPLPQRGCWERRCCVCLFLKTRKMFICKIVCTHFILGDILGEDFQFSHLNKCMFYSAYLYLYSPICICYHGQCSLLLFFLPALGLICLIWNISATTSSILKPTRPNIWQKQNISCLNFLFVCKAD